MLRESIFRASWRAFCRAFFSIFGIAFAVVIAFVFIGAVAKHSHAPRSNFVSIPNHNHQLGAVSAPAILRINIHGIIGLDTLVAKNIQTALQNCESQLPEGHIRAILLHIDSPGGTVNDSDNIYRALKAFAKRHQIPIHVFIDGMCASGGMYIACAADKIVSKPIGIIGSVGVILGPFFNFHQAMDKYGIQQKSFTQGHDKDLLNPFQPWKEKNWHSLNDIMQHEYDHFVDIVAQARPNLTKDKLINEYGARIYDPITAKQLGYIDDAQGSYEETLHALSKAVHLDKDNYQVLEYRPHLGLIPSLLKDTKSLSRITHEIAIPGALPKELEGRPLFLYRP